MGVSRVFRAFSWIVHRFPPVFFVGVSIFFPNTSRFYVEFGGFLCRAFFRWFYGVFEGTPWFLLIFLVFFHSFRGV